MAALLANLRGSSILAPEATMDHAKCRALKTEFATLGEPALVTADRFFDGNDDLGAIGCNLLAHPGIDTFRDVLTGLARRPDVRSVHLVISELDPGEDSWPFSDMVLVASELRETELRRALATLRPDEVGPAETFGLPQDVLDRLAPGVLAAWWD